LLDKLTGNIDEEEEEEPEPVKEAEPEPVKEAEPEPVQEETTPFLLISDIFSIPFGDRNR